MADYDWAEDIRKRLAMPLTISVMERLKLLQTRIERVAEECEELTLEIEELAPWSGYYQDPDQMANEATWFHDERLPWLELEKIKFLIGQLEMQNEAERKAFLAGLGPTEEIPF